MGLTRAEFWDLHPCEFLAMLSRYRHNRMLEEYGTANLNTLYVNAHLQEGAKPHEVTDFMLFAPPKRSTSSDSSVLRGIFQAKLDERRKALQARGLKTQ